jgi:hypothetical protein
MSAACPQMLGALHLMTCRSERLTAGEHGVYHPVARELRERSHRGRAQPSHPGNERGSRSRHRCDGASLQG